MNKQTRIFEKRLRKRRKKRNKRKAIDAKKLSVVKKINRIKHAMKDGTKDNPSGKPRRA